MTGEKKKSSSKNSNLRSSNMGEGKKRTQSVIKEEESEKNKSSNKGEEKKDKPEWQLSLKDPKDRLAYLFQNRTNWDVKFTLVDENKKGYEFFAHTFYLITCSSVLEGMIKDMQKNEKSEIPLTDIHPRVFNKVLRYLYTDKISYANDDETFLLYEAAVNYRLPFLQINCQEHLSKINLKMENVVSLLNNAVTRNNTPLKEKCLEFIVENAEALMKDATRVKLVEEALIAILTEKRIRVRSEESVLKFVVEWAKYRSVDDNIYNITPLLKHVRFDGMTARDFLYIYDGDQKLFNKYQILEILRFMARPEYGLPPWCSLWDTQEKTTKEKDVEEMKGPTIEIASECRLFPKRPEIKTLTTHEISDNVIIYCTQKTEFVLAVKIEWIKLNGCRDAKVSWEGFILKPRSTTPIQSKKFTQQCQFGEDNFIILNFKIPFRMYYGCTLNLSVTLRFLTDVTLDVTADYSPVSYVIVGNKEPDNRKCAIFSAMYYTPTVKQR